MGTDFLEGVEPTDTERVVTHERNSVFHACRLPDVLRGLDASRLFVSGVSTAYVVEGSVRHATDIGYDCVVVGDACATSTSHQHENALAAMAPLAEILTVDEALAAIRRTPVER